jgi:hypothetical protein
MKLTFIDLSLLITFWYLILKFNKYWKLQQSLWSLYETHVTQWRTLLFHKYLLNVKLEHNAVIL